MAQFDDLPDPPGPSDPFNDPSMQGGGYLAGNDDQEIRKIRRRVSPFGKAMVVVVLALLGGVGYFVVKSAMAEQEAEHASADGMRALETLLGTDLPRDQMAARVRDIYQRYNSSERVRMSCRRLLARLHDPQAMPLFIDGLHRGGNERRQAAIAVAEVGMPEGASARDALAEVLPQTSDNVDKAEVTWAMVVLNDPRCWDSAVEQMRTGHLQQVRNLDEPPQVIFDPAMVARMAGVDRLRRLAEMSGRENVTLRRIAALSFGEMATSEVVDVLVRLAGDPDTDVAREAAVGLGRSGDARGGAAIVGFLNSHPDERDAVLAALQQNSGSPGLSIVINTATDPQTRATATRLLRELHDPDGVAAFQRVLQTVPVDTTDELLRGMRRNAIFGLAEVGDASAADGLMELAQRPLAAGTRVDPNADMDARLALDALRKIPGAPARAKTALMAMLPRADFMRTQILLAIGAAGDASLGAQLMTYLANDQSQEGAAVAVCRLGYGPGIARVRADMIRPSALHMNEETVQDEPVFIKRRNAIRGIGWAHDQHFAADLMRIVEDPLDRPALREEAGFALASLADDTTLDQIATRALDTAKTEDIRLYYLYALRTRSTPAIAARIGDGYLRAGVSGALAKAAAIAAGFGGDATTAGVVAPLLRSSDATLKLDAGIAAVLLGDRPTTSALLDELGRSTEFSSLMSNTFVTRSATGNNAGMQLEPSDLMPLTEAMFTDGRVYRRIDAATTLERGIGANHHDFAITWLRLRLRNGWENPLGIGPFEVRQKLRQAAAGSDTFQRDMAFRALRSLDDRGSLLYLRRQPGDVGERARRELLGMAGTASGS